MPDPSDRYPARVMTLRLEHNSHLVKWITRRIVERVNIDVYKLLHAAEGYIDWSALVLEAAILNLATRGWSQTAGTLETLAAKSLLEAQKRPTDGPDGMPALLKSAFYHHALISVLGTEKAPLVAANLEDEMRTVVLLLGEARAQTLSREARIRSRALVATLLSEARAAGEQGLAVPPEPLRPLGPVRSDGRPLSTFEQRLAGWWTYRERYSSPGFSARVELYMILLTDGHAARTTKSIASSSLQDQKGNWIGSIESVSGLRPGERGSWNADATLLSLEMDDGSAYEYRYTHRGSGLITTNTNGGAQRYWTRG